METATRTAHRRRPLAVVGDHLLTVLAVAGALCIALVILSWVFNISIMMFRTGSMSPTITAGSIAFVREIPATEMEEGDVVTVSRGANVLPVTHRVVDIDEVDHTTGEVTFAMRGDANDVDDPEPYTATEVREVIVSVPGAARVVQWFGDPYVLGGLTLGATVLVIWAFWPREQEESDEPEGTSVAHAAGVPLLAALVLAAPGMEHPESTLIAGEHLRMQTTGDPVQMQNLHPGQAVTWEVGVWAEAPEPGEIRLGITGRGELARIDDALRVSVTSCSEPWIAENCSSGAVELLPATSLDRIAEVEPTRLLTTMDADEQRWLRIEVVLDDSGGAVPADAEGDVLVHASGAGEEISTGPDAPGGDAPGGDAPGGDASGPDAPGSDAPGGDGEGSGGGHQGDDRHNGDLWGEGLARTGASGVVTLLSAGLLAVVLGLALRRARGRGER